MKIESHVTAGTTVSRSRLVEKGSGKCDQPYLHEPSDVRTFWENYPYFDPKILYGGAGRRYHFFELIKLRKDPKRFNERLNQYLNVKFNPIGSYQSLEQNCAKFSPLASASSDILRRILERAQLPSYLNSIFQETGTVRSTNNIVDLLNLYVKKKEVRLKYEIIRKLGLAFLLCRVKNAPVFQESFKYHDHLNEIMWSQLGIMGGGNQKDSLPVYFWLSPSGKLALYRNERRAHHQYALHVQELKDSGKRVYPMQSETFCRQKTRKSNTVLKYISRIKNQCEGREDYTSVIEKIIRKNLLHPPDVNDIYGITLVVTNERAIDKLIVEIESFLGGTNTRKAEKVIQKAVSSEFISSPDDESFRIWKAIYDITLPDNGCAIIDQEIKKNTDDLIVLQGTLSMLSRRPRKSAALRFLKEHIDKRANELANLKKTRAKMVNRPFDMYVEIQIQELHSYLMSRCYGSATEHTALKRNQVLSSTFYKLFPKKIYGEYLLQLNQ